MLRWKHIIRINIPKPPFIELRLGTQADLQVHSKCAFYEAGGWAGYLVSLKPGSYSVKMKKAGDVYFT